MTYIQLVNQVLIRLRENTIDEATADDALFLSNPYFKSLGQHVNDAKDRVEQAWQWGALRGTDNFLCSGLSRIELENSADNDYVLHGLFSYNGTDKTTVNGEVSNVILKAMRHVTPARMQQNYQNSTDITEGQPQEFAIVGNNATTGNIEIKVYPSPDSGTQWELQAERYATQDALSNASDVLKVPALPVYSLATALASRERGELSGAPTSELFGLADRNLSDAIAIDSARYAHELDWYVPSNYAQTNFRTA